MPARKRKVVEHYTKPALTFEQQLAHLKDCGLEISSTENALQTLSTISYYRLSGYWHPFRYRDEKDKIYDHFVSGATLNEAVALYEFDRRLRSLIMDAIERIEVLIRTRITYHISHSYGPFGHTSATNFHPNFNHSAWLKKLNNEAERSSEEFIRHYKENYTGFPKLPIWMLTEVMSFGAF